MKVELLSSSIPPSESQFLVGFLVNDEVAIDAGPLGLLADLRKQERVRHVFITHEHIDHIATLPIFLENVYEPGPDCVELLAVEDVLDFIHHDIFNGRVWPEFFALSTSADRFVRGPEDAGEWIIFSGGLLALLLFGSRFFGRFFRGFLSRLGSRFFARLLGGGIFCDRWFTGGSFRSRFSRGFIGRRFTGRRLTEQIVCRRGLRCRDGLRIVTHGYECRLRVVFRILFGFVEEVFLFRLGSLFWCRLLVGRFSCRFDGRFDGRFGFLWLRLGGGCFLRRHLLGGEIKSGFLLRSWLLRRFFRRENLFGRLGSLLGGGFGENFLGGLELRRRHRLFGGGWRHGWLERG